MLKEKADLIEKTKYLQQYYKDKNTSIIGLNDSQGIDTSLLFRKGILELVRDKLISAKNDIDIFNAFSLMFNKTEHIDYFLDCNLTLEEVKKLQVEGVVSALSKFFHTDLKIPKVLGNLGTIGYISKLLYKPNENDSRFALTDTIINSTEPIVIYSCGANDLMREGWCNPFSIDKAYKNRYQDRTYFYALNKFQNPNTIKNVISRVEHNFDHILSLNSQTDLFALGLYLPLSMQKEELQIFKEAVNEYNLQLQELCQKYGVNYIDTYEAGTALSKDTKNFHASHRIHHVLADQLIEKLYQKKKEIFNKNTTIPTLTVSENNNNLIELYKKLFNDCLTVTEEKNAKEVLLRQHTESGSNTSDDILTLAREVEINENKIKELELQKTAVFKVLYKRKVK